MSRGFAKKRGRTWTYYLDAVDPATGKRRQVSKGGYRTKVEAMDALDEVRLTSRNRGYVEQRKGTVRAFLLDEWLPTVNKRPSTVASYRWLMETYVIPQLGALPLAKVTPVLVREMADQMSTSGSRKQQPLSPRTVDYTLTVLKMAFTYGVAEGWLQRNPAAGIRGPHQVKAEIEAWTAEEAGAFLDAVADDRLYACWLLLLTRGPRRGEVCGLRWADVDLDAGRMSIVSTEILVKGKQQTSTPKTDSGRRTVPLDAELVASLKTHRKVQLEERMAWGPAWTDTGHVFTREDGRLLRPQGLSAMFDVRLARAGLRRITLHGTRHTAATLALRAGIPTEYVSKWLGHANPGITQTLYQHVTPSLSEDQAAKLTSLVLAHRSTGR